MACRLPAVVLFRKRRLLIFEFPLLVSATISGRFSLARFLDFISLFRHLLSPAFYTLFLLLERLLLILELTAESVGLNRPHGRAHLTSRNRVFWPIDLLQKYLGAERRCQKKKKTPSLPPHCVTRLTNRIQVVPVATLPLALPFLLSASSFFIFLLSKLQPLSLSLSHPDGDLGVFAFAGFLVCHTRNNTLDPRCLWAPYFVPRWLKTAFPHVLAQRASPPQPPTSQATQRRGYLGSPQPLHIRRGNNFTRDSRPRNQRAAEPRHHRSAPQFTHFLLTADAITTAPLVSSFTAPHSTSQHSTALAGCF